jgi:putative endonuclease
MSGRGVSFFVYILLCNDGSYYTGYSNNPFVRFVKHVKGQGARYTRLHKPSRIVYLQRLKSRGAAMRREREIKEFTHEQKRSLIGRGARVGFHKRLLTNQKLLAGK